MNTRTIYPRGVCPTAISVTTDAGTVVEVATNAGCPGLTQGLAAVLRGMPVVEAVEKLRGIQCGNRGTSCPDQIARALEEC